MYRDRRVGICQLLIRLCVAGVGLRRSNERSGRAACATMALQPMAVKRARAGLKRSQTPCGRSTRHIRELGTHPCSEAADVASLDPAATHA